MTTTGGLEARNITVRHGGLVATNDVTITVEPGQVHGLIGPNGAGKSSLVDAITGFTRYTGTVKLKGEFLDNLAPHARRARGLARTWQDGELFKNLTVAETIGLAVQRAGFGTIARDIFTRWRSGADPQTQAVLDLLGLGDVASARTESLPLGQQKIVGVARSLVGDPAAVVLDEPAAGLDGKNADTLSVAIMEVARQGIAVLVIGHDIPFMRDLCHEMTVLDYGEIIAVGAPDDVFSDPKVVDVYVGGALDA